MTSTLAYIVVVGGPSNRLPAPSSDLQEGEMEEVRLAAEERVAELTSRGQGPAPANFYDWTKGSPCQKKPCIFGHCPNYNLTPPKAQIQALCGTIFLPKMRKFFKQQF